MGTEAMSWAPAELDLSRPNAARMYDYFLGGSHNFAADRQAADAVLAVAPHVADAARANREFLRRSVRYALQQGIRQFIDLGSGIPTVGNVHDIAHSVNADARVLYVDVEPVAVAHARALLGVDPRVDVIQADICFPDSIFNNPATQRLIDLGRPVAILFVSVLHFIPGDVNAIVEPFRAAASPGSALVISHATSGAATSQTEEVQRLYQRTPTPLQLRTAAEVETLFGHFHMVPASSTATSPTSGAPLVPVAEWRPEPDDQVETRQSVASPFLNAFLAGMGRKGVADHG
ncbi:SAM-dependent methyltransferase [Micromonospora sp. WMMD980]|uniref:SAM-dependent methyltransferase n=1 Tax=Micromonospora sp. WMMD980 TaxID=3016088 RepID=UPI0024163A56|nr:SAM-dependent methyltransferase [Micromonospora sp. WMMD980]MDG4800505.1 SAM-dependent methyltransferase [Micromonospora sp. WMMD980]